VLELDILNSTKPQPILYSNLQGWAAFLYDEISSYSDLSLVWERETGIPSWLQGSYIKNGPGRKQFGDDRYYSSYLDSWGKLHKFTFNDGQATFSGRMIETTNYNRSVKAGKMTPTISLAHVLPNDWNMIEMMEGAMNGFDNNNVMVWKLGPADKSKGQYIATTDYPTVHEIDPDTMRIKATYGLPMIEGMSVASSAHWRREVGKDSSIQYHMIYNPLTAKVDFTLFRFFDTYQDHEKVGKFQMPHMSIIHMFSHTENFAVIVLYPVTMDFLAMFNHNMHPFETITKLDTPTRFYLINLNDGSVIDGFESDDPQMVFATHHANAWEEDGQVVLDLACNPWDALATFMDIETMLNATLTTNDKADFVMKRVRLDIAEKSVTVEDWPNARNIPILNTIDFPLINNDYTGVKNRYVYGWASIDYWRQTLVKKDLEDSTNDLTWSEASHYPGEVSFVPRPGADDEDDGLLVTVVFDGELKRSYLLLIDGKTFEEVNRSYLPFNVPFSFHGNWFPELH
jgi:carotenoid cleavage dioxygenase-like enzyme